LWFRILEDIVQYVERTGTPELLPIFRSRQQAELLADVLDAPDREQSLTELGERLGIPGPSVHREVERAERAGIVRSRRVGHTRLVSADTSSPYYAPLRELLVAAFGVPARLRAALEGVPGVEDAFIYGSWAARWHGEPGSRPVGDVDVLVLGDPDRDQLYAAAHEVSVVVGREVQVQVREPGWIESGAGSFHDTVVGRPMVDVLRRDGHDRNADASPTARSAS
jgi:DNA-binding Lrp family transcriptional regulator